jgi:hypothetical protein
MCSLLMFNCCAQTLPVAWCGSEFGCFIVLAHKFANHVAYTREVVIRKLMNEMVGLFIPSN